MWWLNWAGRSRDRTPVLLQAYCYLSAYNFQSQSGCAGTQLMAQRVVGPGRGAGNPEGYRPGYGVCRQLYIRRLRQLGGDVGVCGAHPEVALADIVEVQRDLAIDDLDPVRAGGESAYYGHGRVCDPEAELRDSVEFQSYWRPRALDGHRESQWSADGVVESRGHAE